MSRLSFAYIVYLYVWLVVLFKESTNGAREVNNVTKKDMAKSHVFFYIKDIG